MLMSDEPTITALGEARDRARRAVLAGRPGGLLDPRTAIDDYKSALADCALDRETLTAIHEELMQRLDRGLVFSGRDDTVGNLFASLASRWEATDDLLNGKEARRRLARWEVMVADAQLAACAGGGRP